MCINNVYYFYIEQNKLLSLTLPVHQEPEHQEHNGGYQKNPDTEAQQK